MKLRGILTVILCAAALSSGCSSRGEGITLNGDGLHVGTSLGQRDKIAQDKADAEIAQVEARTVIEQDRAAASIEQSAAMGEVVRPVVFTLAMAAALGVVALGVGYASQQATPALATALEVRKARSFQVALDVTRDGCQATLTASGYSAGELSDVIRGAPMLNAPALAELQSRAGARGVRALLENGELEMAMARLPIETEVRKRCEAPAPPPLS